MKKAATWPPMELQNRGRVLSSAREEEEVRDKAIEHNHDYGRDGEPDRGENRGRGEEFLHGRGSVERGSQRRVGWRGTQPQRGDTVTLLSDSSSLPLVYSPKAAKGQVAAARVLLNARGRSIWISFIVASLPRMAWR